MDETRNMFYYVVMIMSMFAKKFSMSIRDAYFYLNKYKGFEFLEEFYDVNHTLNSDDVVDDLRAICEREGGELG